MYSSKQISMDIVQIYPVFLILCLPVIWGKDYKKDCYALDLLQYSKQKKCKDAFVEIFLASCSMYKRSVRQFDGRNSRNRSERRLDFPVIDGAQRARKAWSFYTGKVRKRRKVGGLSLRDWKDLCCQCGCSPKYLSPYCDL